MRKKRVVGKKKTGLKMLGEGKSIKEVMASLGVSESTVVLWRRELALMGEKKSGLADSKALDRLLIENEVLRDMIERLLKK